MRVESPALALIILSIVGMIGLSASVAVYVMIDSPIQAETRTEKFHADKHCASISGKREVRLSDGTRADCMTSSHVFEVDFADKWYEAVGQALHYAKQSNKRGAAVIVCRRSTDAEKLRRLLALVEFYSLPMDVFSMECGEL